MTWWWCKQDKPFEYGKVKSNTVDYFINKTIEHEKIKKLNINWPNGRERFQANWENMFEFNCCKAKGLLIGMVRKRLTPTASCRPLTVRV